MAKATRRQRVGDTSDVRYHKDRINVEITPRYAVRLDKVAPHGQLGQSYDSSNCTAVFGALDDYCTASTFQERLSVVLTLKVPSKGPGMNILLPRRSPQTSDFLASS